MDKILAFSILSSSPADLSARLSWRTSAARKAQPQPQQAEAPAHQEKKKKKKAAERPAETSRPRFAPEFGGLNCFESIVSF